MLLSLATFGVGFFARPLGGLLIGRMADRRGRKPAMILSFTIMGVAMTGLALTPSYAAIGMAAPVLAVIFRLMQGFALGGEVGPNIAFLMEAAPPHRRGFYISLNFAIGRFRGDGRRAWSACAVVAAEPGGARRVGLARRVPVRRRNRSVGSERCGGRWSRPCRRSERACGDDSAPRPLVLLAVAGLLVIAGGTISNYTLEYLTTYAQATLHMAVPTAFAATVVLGVIGVAGDLSAGCWPTATAPSAC